MSAPLRILRKPEVESRVGLKRERIAQLEREGRFPKRIKISDRASGWVESEIEAWIASRVAMSRGAQSAPGVAR
jgi:prophage regulatory protein